MSFCCHCHLTYSDKITDCNDLLIRVQAHFQTERDANAVLSAHIAESRICHEVQSICTNIHAVLPHCNELP
jgi:hypothetical protein